MYTAIILLVGIAALFFGSWAAAWPFLILGGAIVGVRWARRCSRRQARPAIPYM